MTVLSSAFIRVFIDKKSNSQPVRNCLATYVYVATAAGLRTGRVAPGTRVQPYTLHLALHVASYICLAETDPPITEATQSIATLRAPLISMM